jgi:hypothetical protein
MNFFSPAAKETTRKKIEMIVRTEFHQELKNKEKELDCIDQVQGSGKVSLTSSRLL